MKSVLKKRLERLEQELAGRDAPCGLAAAYEAIRRGDGVLKAVYGRLDDDK